MSSTCFLSVFISFLFISWSQEACASCKTRVSGSPGSQGVSGGHFCHFAIRLCTKIPSNRNDPQNVHSGSSQGPPGTSRDPRDPQGPPRDPQGHPRDAEGPPSGPQGSPGTPAGTPRDPRDPQGPPGTPRDLQGPPRDSQGPPVTPGTPRDPRDHQGPPRDPQGRNCCRISIGRCGVLAGLGGISGIGWVLSEMHYSPRKPGGARSQ